VPRAAIAQLFDVDDLDGQDVRARALHPIVVAMSTAMRFILGGLLAFGALNAFGGGIYGLLGAQDVPISWLEGSPFSTYFIPSLILFVIVGGALTLAAIATFARWRHARTFVLGAAVIVLGWIAVQVALIGFVSWMQPVTAIGAIIAIVLGSQLGPEHAPTIDIEDAASRFFAKGRIAVTGVSRHAPGHGSNIVFKRLLERGFEVYPVNPNATEIDGHRCYPNLRAIPGGVGAVLIGTRPERAEDTMKECADLGIDLVWMHRSFGPGSVSEQAAAVGRQQGITVIAGGCPCMFEPAADRAHKVMRVALTVVGKVPRRVEPAVASR
jgi:uncharacterized protein